MCNWSLNDLSDTLEQMDYQVRFLISLVCQVAEEEKSYTSKRIKILRKREEIMEYVYHQEADCLVLRSPGDMPFVLKRKELGWIQDTDEFADWLMINWTDQTMVIALS